MTNPPLVLDPTAVNAAALEDTGSAAQLCPGCAHSTEAHDARAIRFCAATVQMASSRACICRDAGAQVKAGAAHSYRNF